jgi:trimeric autotransporter adhesin
MRCLEPSRRIFFGLLASGALAFAQPYTISTVAGGAPPATPAPAASMSLGQPLRVTTDGAGNLYFTSLNCVFRVDSGGNLTLIAGNSRAGFSGDGGPAVEAQLSAPAGLAIDFAGDIFIADSANNVVREVTPDGIIHTVAGNGLPGVPGSLGDFGPATQANLHTPSGVAVDDSGDLFIADSADNSIREVTPDGNISTFAGNGYPGYAGDTGAPFSAALWQPQDVAVASNGIIYIADTGNAVIRAVSQGIINTVAGNTTVGYAGDGAAATSANLFEPFAVTVDTSGNFYIADLGNDVIRKVTVTSGSTCTVGTTTVACPTGNISTVAGMGTLPSFSGDGSAATKANLEFPSGVVVDNQGNLYIADTGNRRIRKVNTSGTISTVAGNGLASYSGDLGPATAAQLNSPTGVGVDTSGNIYVADSLNGVVREVLQGGTIFSIGGGTLVSPQGVAVDSSGNAYIADPQDNRVRKIGADGSFTVFAGNGTPGYSGDGGAATNAELNWPISVAVDQDGNVYIADFYNYRIRKVGIDGTITTVAGNGIQGYSGDGGPATLASINGSLGIAVDTAGNLYIADANNSRVREVTVDGIIQTIAGTGVPGYTGDGGAAASAQIISPKGVVVDAMGSVYFVDGTTLIRKILPGGVITTIAGNGTQGYSGDGGVATQAQLNAPTGLWLDAAGNVYVADTGNNAVRLLQPAGPVSPNVVKPPRRPDSSARPLPVVAAR